MSLPRSANMIHNASMLNEKHAMQNELLDEAQAAAVLGVEPRTLRLWRLMRGVPHYRLTQKAIRYRRSDLDGWLDQHRVAMVTGRGTPQN
jgi:hypothetical protein